MEDQDLGAATLEVSSMQLLELTLVPVENGLIALHSIVELLDMTHAWYILDFSDYVWTECFSQFLGSLN
ncbi:hypothetical protein RIF29_38280 [Crotalaria pallida]|uniref:Uncharacterized protein n=1 Tax=Crotalaria pallida TaxID=3830 RepID=A0AAN9HPJ8_CROPI